MVEDNLEESVEFDPFSDNLPLELSEEVNKELDVGTAQEQEETEEAEKNKERNISVNHKENIENVDDKSNETSDKPSVFGKYSFVVELAAYIIFAVLFISLVPKYVMERVSVDGSSMNKTLTDGDQLIGEKISVRADRLKRFDIIYFYPLGNKESEAYIKRIIGLPGDTVRIKDSTIYVNNVPLSEDYAAEANFEAYDAEEAVYLNTDEYFVLGDNRNHSTDSRFRSVGVVNRKDISGRAVFRLWPINAFGKID